MGFVFKLASRKVFEVIKENRPSVQSTLWFEKIQRVDMVDYRDSGSI